MAINIFSKNKQSQKFALDLNKGAASKKKQLPKHKRKKSTGDYSHARITQTMKIDNSKQPELKKSCVGKW